MSRYSDQEHDVTVVAKPLIEQPITNRWEPSSFSKKDEGSNPFVVALGKFRKGCQAQGRPSEVSDGTMQQSLVGPHGGGLLENQE